MCVHAVQSVLLRGRNNAMNMNVLLTGVGGQGTVLASKIIAQCAINKGLTAKTAETIGMAQRGGCVVSHVRFGDAVYSPLIPMGEADVIIAFEPAEAVRSLPYLKKNGTVIVNRKPIKPVTDSLAATSYEAEAMLNYLRENTKHLVIVDGDSALKTLGSSKVLNLVLLGRAVPVLGFDAAELDAVIDEKIPERFRKLNKKAVRAIAAE